MDMDMDGGGSDSFTVLNDTGIDFSNETQALDFLGEILDDTYLQVVGNQYARYFWYGVVVVIGISAISNLLTQQTLRHRLLRARKTDGIVTRPSNWLSQTLATVTAILREISNLQPPTPLPHLFRSFPTSGTSLLVVSYFAFILALEFVNSDYPGAQHYQALSIRAAWLAVSQVPLIILLAGKNNLIGLLAGVNYQRLNTYHRWVARGLLLLSTLHFGFESGDWAKYGLMVLEWDTDSCPPTGMAAYAVLLWINISTLPPFRNMSYEFFVIQHLLTFFGFIVAVMLHLPSTAVYSRVYIWIPIGLYIFDRAVRTLRYTWSNSARHNATLIPLDGTATKIRIPSRQIKRWGSGAHVQLSIPKLGLIQSHPATILSSPFSHEGDLVFLLRAHRGFTRRLAKASADSLLTEKASDSEAQQQTKRYLALIDGPYPSSHNDLAAYDIMTLVAAGTGISFTTSIMLGLAHRASSSIGNISGKLPLRIVNLIWIIKKSSWLSWVSEEIQSTSSPLQKAGIELNVEVFITCDPTCLDNDANPSSSSSSSENCCGEVCNCVSPDTGGEKKGVCGCCTTAATVSDEPSLQKRHPWATTINLGRPELYQLLTSKTEQALGESAVGACGPAHFSAEVRNTVVRISDARAVNKGSGAQGIYLHVESSYS